MRNNMSVCFTISRKLHATEKDSFEVERNLFGPFNLGGAGRSCGFSVGASKVFVVGLEIVLEKLLVLEVVKVLCWRGLRLVGFDKTSVQSPALFALRILVGTKNVEILNTDKDEVSTETSIRKKQCEITAFATAPCHIQFQTLSLTRYPRSLSDHCQFVLQSGQQDWGWRAFRFFKCWINHPSFMKDLHSFGNNVAINF
ncbi:hypothetical protein NC651_000302 [Populus alba x Populus x berolinensis]|nr:hypothetical protein NC651_000302 [Populus alba x Populus x berolinensis]